MKTKENYREYLKSRDWKYKRSRKLSKSKRRCAICGSNDKLDVHHVNYKNWYDVTTEDLRIICRECHDLIHKLEKEGVIKYKNEHPNTKYGVQKSAVTAYRKQKAIQEAGGILKCYRCAVTEKELKRKEFKHYRAGRFILCKNCKDTVSFFNTKWIQYANRKRKKGKKLTEAEREIIWKFFMQQRPKMLSKTWKRKKKTSHFLRQMEEVMPDNLT